MKRFSWVVSLWALGLAGQMIACDRADSGPSTAPSVTPAAVSSSGQAIPSRPGPVDADTAAKAFVALLGKGNFAQAAAQFDAKMKSALPEDNLRDTWKTLISQVGAFQGTGSTRIENSGGYTIVFVTSQFEKARLDVKIVFDPSGQIAGLFFAPSPA